MCDCCTPQEPIPTNKRYGAAKIFSNPAVAAEVPWYGIEQEYTLLQNNIKWPVGSIVILLQCWCRQSLIFMMHTTKLAFILALILVVSTDWSCLVRESMGLLVSFSPSTPNPS
ncbi:uncharacterized protein LOC144556994 isoform X5 [Carex rostrata]